MCAIGLDNTNPKHHVYHLGFLTENWYTKADTAAVNDYCQYPITGRIISHHFSDMQPLMLPNLPPVHAAHRLNLACI